MIAGFKFVGVVTAMHTLRALRLPAGRGLVVSLLRKLQQDCRTGDGFCHSNATVQVAGDGQDVDGGVVSDPRAAPRPPSAPAPSRSCRRSPACRTPPAPAAARWPGTTSCRPSVTTLCELRAYYVNAAAL